MKEIMTEEKLNGRGNLDWKMSETNWEGSLEVEELDQSGEVVATYIASEKVGRERRAEGEGERIDVVIPKRTNATWVKDLLAAFLPAGYPHSVTDDYLEYQVYDSLQAFSSSIASLLASRAVLKGVGVGDSDATPTAALFLSILQSSLGQFTTILFAHYRGTAFEPECKMYRLSADIWNDSAIILDFVSPAFPKYMRVLLYGLTSIFRAFCIVSAGSSKASLSAHFAKWGNLGELNAKDSSQETVISLMGMLAGSVVVSCISSQFATSVTIVFLLAIHLGTNYLAVRAVKMRTLNRQRANIVFSHFISPSPIPQSTIKEKEESPTQSRILTPKQVCEAERIFERDGALRWNGKQIYGSCLVGVNLQSILKEMSAQNPKSKSFTNAPVDPRRIIKSLNSRGYFLWYSHSKNRYQITFSTAATVRTQLLAWFHALITAREIHDGQASILAEGNIQMTEGSTRCRSVIRQLLRLEGGRREGAGSAGAVGVEDLWEFLDLTGTVAKEKFDVLWKGLEETGWDLETGALETKSGTRVKTIGSGTKTSEN